jgi:hypothetical protein
VTGGEIVWNAAAGDFDWDRTTAVSSALKGRFGQEPLYVDMRWVSDPASLSLRHTQFRSAILDIAATVRGIPKDELDGEDVRQHRRTRAFALTAILAVVIFAVLAGWQAFVANARRRDAEGAPSRNSVRKQSNSVTLPSSSDRKPSGRLASHARASCRCGRWVNWM